MFSSNLIRVYHVLHKCTPYMSFLAFDAATFVWITQSISFANSSQGDLDGVISKNGKTLAYKNYKSI